MSTTTSGKCDGWRDARRLEHVECEKGTRVRKIAVAIAGVELEVAAMCAACQKLSLEAEREARVTRSLDEFVRRSDASDRLRVFDLATYPRGTATDAARRVAEEWLAGYIAGARTNLYLWGAAGRGKSGLAWSIARRLVEEGAREFDPDDPYTQRLPAVLVNFRMLLARIKEGWDTGERTERVSSYFGVRVLVIDDIGSESPSTFNRSELLTLIDARYERRLPTIFTSNLPLAGLRTRFGDAADGFVDGERIVSRVAEDVVIHELGGRDLRVSR